MLPIFIVGLRILKHPPILHRICNRALNMDRVEEIKEKFENFTYSLDEVPGILVADYSGVYLHKDGLNQDVIESLEDMDWPRDRRLNPKLKVESSGDYSLGIGLIGTQYFDSHEKLDTIYAEKWEEYPPEDPPVMRENISLEDAMDLLTVKISCDMDYYLANREEMQTDLGKSLNGLDLSDANVLEQLQKELFHNQMNKIFGDGEDGGRGAIILENYHILNDDGNNIFATAKRGNYFWIIDYSTS